MVFVSLSLRYFLAKAKLQAGVNHKPFLSMLQTGWTQSTTDFILYHPASLFPDLFRVFGPAGVSRQDGTKQCSPLEIDKLRAADSCESEGYRI